MVELISIAVLWSLCPSKIHLPSQIFSYFSNYMLWSQKLKIRSKLSELTFFPHKCLLRDVILNEVVNKLTRRKHFLWKKCLCVGNVNITHRGSFVLLSFFGELLVIYHYSNNFACFYFDTSQVGHPQVFRK